MHRILLILVLASALQLHAEGTRFAILSDPHVLSQSLLSETSAATLTLTRDEPKLVEKSQELFDSAMLRIMAEAPDFLLMPGDLTYNGELLSHQHVTQQLQQLRSAGIQTFVIPGNHDVNGPNAADYSGDQRVKTASLDAASFVELYQDFGYGQAIMRHPEGLSYLVYLNDDLALLCLDSTTPNDSLHNYSAGGLTDSLLAWIDEAALRAHNDGRALLCMMHHQLMEHFDNQAVAASNYIANLDEGYPQLEEVQNRLSAAGIEVVFTGHFHINSIQHVYTATSELIDLSTGALCSYASPIRFCSISSEGLLTVTTQHLTLHDALARSRNSIIVNSVIRQGASVLYPMMSSYATQLPTYVSSMVNLPKSETQMYEDLQSYLGAVALDIYNTLAHGDEEQHDPAAKLQAFHDAMDAYMLSVCRGNAIILALLKVAMADKLDAYMGQADAMLESVLYNYVGTPDNFMPDGTFTFALNLPAKEGIRAVRTETSSTLVRDSLGRRNSRVNTPIIVNGRKIIYK